MTIQTAIDDLVSTLEAESYLKVIEGVQEPGSSDYTLMISFGSNTTTKNFGTRRIMQEVILNLYVKIGIDVGAISLVLDNINQAIIDDRRRNGLAQTTTIGDWSVEDNNGREGLTLQMTTEVHVYESDL